MTVDELLADPITAAELPHGAIPTHAYIIIEYENPSSDNEPGQPRIARCWDEHLTAWQQLGYLTYAIARAHDDIDDYTVEDDDPINPPEIDDP